MVSPICDRTDRETAISSVTRMWSRTERMVIPMNIVTVMNSIMLSVEAAFFDCGRRKACTPSATASTPVSAVAPDENARRIRNKLTVAVASKGRCAVSAIGHPERHRTKPVRNIR
jgi:hypothetical protein